MASSGKFGWGGARPGSGSKPKGDRAGVSHLSRADVASRHPVFVTMRLKKDVPTLRRKAPYKVLRGAFEKGGEKPGFRVVHYSLQKEHLYLIVEARDREALARGLQALFVRIARGLNRLWERKGSVFADRYAAVVLKTPEQVRNALLYVLQNCRKHGYTAPGPDPYSTGPWFDGWKERLSADMRGSGSSGAAQPRTGLLRNGWRRGGLLSVRSGPGEEPA